jgi:hypothetical protein
MTKITNKRNNFKCIFDFDTFKNQYDKVLHFWVKNYGLPKQSISISIILYL